MSLLPEYSRLFDTLNNHEIPFCLLRDELPGSSLMADLDVLVGDKEFHSAVQVLQSRGYRIKNTDGLNPHKVVLIKYVEGKFVVLDLHRRIVHKGLVYLNHQHVLDRRRQVGNYYLPTETDLLMILVFHNILAKKTIQDKHYAQIRTLANRLDRDYAERTLKEFGTAKIFFAILDQMDRIRTDQQMLLELRRGIFRSIYLKNPLACCKVNWLKLKTYLFRLSPRERGFLISCLGVDGAGKSSLAAALCDAFNGHPCFQASVEYMGPWGHYYLNILDRFTYNHRYVLTTSEFARKLFRKARAKKTSFFKILKLGYQVALGKKLDEDEKQIHLVVRENSRFYLLLRYVRSVAYAMFFFFLIMIEMYYRYFKIYRRLRRGQIVITDRYIYDLMVGSMHEVASTHGRIRSFLCAIFFKPDKVFLLRNTPQQTLARKNQLTAGNLEAIQMIYDELARQHHFTNVLTDCEPRILAQRLIEAHFDEIVNAVRI